MNAAKIQSNTQGASKAGGPRFGNKVHSKRAGDRRVASVSIQYERRSGDRRAQSLKSKSIENKKVASTCNLDVAYHDLKRVVSEAIEIDFIKDLSDKEFDTHLSELIDECIENSKVILSLNEKTKLKRRIQDDIIGLGPLTDLMNDNSITDIMINGPKEVWVEKDGQMIKENIEFTDDNQLMNIVYRITSKINRHVDEHSPMLDARMPDGSRINIILPPLAVNGPSLSIRKFSNDGFSLEKLVSSGALSSEAADLLASKIANKKNILITGGTGTGKTTMLQALAEKINRSERVISIEDTAELKLSQPNLVSLECRPPNIEDRGAISIRQLLRNSLRMRPDRIIIGEVRGAEAGDMLQAMNTGHEGCMGTIHANSPADAVQRFENMICMDQQYLPGLPTRRQIYNVIDVVVHMGRSPEGKRCVLKIAEIKELNGESILMRNVYEHGNDDQEIENPEKTGDQNGKRLFAS